MGIYRIMHDLPGITNFVTKTRYSRQWLYYYFISYTLFYFAKNNYRSPISPLSLWTVFSDLAMWCHYSWSVTSCEYCYCDVLFIDCSACANWRKCDLHEWITAMNIDLKPRCIHGLACKKLQSCTKAIDTPFDKGNVRFLQTQKSPWYPHPVYTTYGGCMKCRQVVICNTKYIDFFLH